ncbi:hypothetical protein YC2023_049388 [Brassica napus]
MATSHNIQDLLGFWREALGSTSMKVNWLPSFSFHQGRKVYMKLCLLVVSLYPGRKAYMMAYMKLLDKVYKQNDICWFFSSGTLQSQIRG